MFRCLPGALSLSFAEPKPLSLSLSISLSRSPFRRRGFPLRPPLPSARVSLFLFTIRSFLPFSPPPSPPPTSLVPPSCISMYIGLKRRTRARSRFTVRWTVKRLISPPSQIGKRPFSARPRKTRSERERKCGRGEGRQLEAGLKDLTDDLRPQLG